MAAAGRGLGPANVKHQVGRKAAQLLAGAYAQRLAWLTGFGGSAGSAVVLADEAAVFVDGRYTLQAAKQVDRKAWHIEPLADPPPEHWLAKHLAAGDRLGFDPWLHTSAAAERLAAACTKAGAELIAVDSNPLDQVWTERPAPPLGPVSVHGMQFSGEIEAEKLKRIRLEIHRLGADAVVLSDSHAVAWAFNVRGADLVVTPELSLCGYPPEDLLLRPSLQPRVQAAMALLKAVEGIVLVVGYPHADQQRRFNSAAVIASGHQRGFYHKQCLPNYGVFDEKRVFQPGPAPGPISFKGVRIGVPICEDIWTEETCETLAETGAAAAARHRRTAPRR